MEQDAVFKALADPSRRLLLDKLFQRDGQTLTELCSHLSMSRNGCTKHLKILEEANLITIHWAGREKYHYLNPVPIQQVYDRWVSKYAQPFTQTMQRLKSTLESDTMPQKPSHVFQIFIRTTPETLWKAITDGDVTQQYYFNTRVESDWQPGSQFKYLYPDGNVAIIGEVLEVDPPHKLVTTLKPLWSPELEAMPPSKVTWEIVQKGEVCQLTLTHTEIEEAAASEFFAGWSQILSGLKTVLETGEPLVIAG